MELKQINSFSAFRYHNWRIDLTRPVSNHVVAAPAGAGSGPEEHDIVSKSLLTLNVNNRCEQHAVADNALLLDVLRDTLGLTGTKQGCDGGECGACTVLVDDQPQLACLTLAATCTGRRIETIEHLASDGRMSRLQRAFHESLGTQCGFCTPGMIMASEALLRRVPQPNAAQIRDALSGNLCRCTGYVKIIESVQTATEGAP